MCYETYLHHTPALTVLVSCEKTIVDEQGGGDGTTPASSGQVTDEDKHNALTISQAQETAVGEFICVKGYLVASTSKSIGNCCFSAPFAGSSAIVLAKRPATDDVVYYEEDIMPICLTDASKGIRESFNLESNPQRWNSFVYVVGTKAQYLGLPGVKRVRGIVVEENHDASTDEELTNGGSSLDVDPDDGGDNSGEEIGDGGDPESGDNDAPDVTPSKILSVAQAKNVKEYTTVTVEGYIVAASSKDIRQWLQFADFKETAAIVLADKPFDVSAEAKDQYDLVNFSDLFPVCLTEQKMKKWRELLNLKEHPENQNKRIRLKGTTQDYIWTRGIVEIDAESVKWVP